MNFDFNDCEYEAWHYAPPKRKRVTHWLLLALVLCACNKSLPTPEMPKWNDWCGKKVAFFGDSFTQAAGYWPLPFQFAVRYSGDSIVIGTYPKDSVDINGNRYGGYLRDGMAYQGGIGGQTSTQIADRYLADTINNNYPLVIWIGRNDGVHNAATIRANIAMMLAYLRNKDQYVIVSVLAGDYRDGEDKGTEWTGTAIGDGWAAFNEGLRQEHGLHYVPANDALGRAARTSQDTLDALHGVTPVSLRAGNKGSDPLHLNNEGEAVVADAIARQLQVCSVGTRQGIK